MIDLSEAYVKSTAFNDASFANAKKLANSKKIVNTYITKEKDLIYGECMGSGKSNYKVSVDFVNPTEPVFRCSCPSRQIPCKHTTALLYQYFLDARIFRKGELPEEVASKREKIEKKAEKKKIEPDKPKKVNVSAFVKKMEVQVQGLELVEKFIGECLLTGFASLTITQIKSYKKEFVKELGNYYLPDFQGKIEAILDELEQATKRDDEMKLVSYIASTQQLTRLQALVEKSKAVLNESIKEKKTVEAQTVLAFTRMGYIWKLEELKQLGLYKENVSLVQLGFYDYSDAEEKAYIDEGVYISLENGEIYQTQNIRPYKLTARLKEEDSQFEKVQVPECMIYPGDMNKRIRWEGYTTTPITKEDLSVVREKAHTDYKTVLKAVKNQLKDVLADDHPIMLVHYEEIFRVGEQLAIRDAQGETILLGSTKRIGMEHSLIGMQFILQEADLKNQVMLGMFEYKAQSSQLIMQPICVVTASEVKRLLG